MEPLTAEPLNTIADAYRRVGTCMSAEIQKEMQRVGLPAGTLKATGGPEQLEMM